MAKITVYLHRPENPRITFAATFDVEPAERFSFRFSALKNVLDKTVPIPGLNGPNITYNAVESAIQSGAFYARHKAQIKSCSVDLIAFSLSGHTADVMPFAVATTVAVYEAIRRLRQYTANELSGWKVVSLQNAADDTDAAK